MSEAFLAQYGWAGAGASALAGDASARRFQRLTRGSETAILMHTPTALAHQHQRFLAMARWLTAQGFSAPAILADSAPDGLILMEDLGDDALLNALPGAEALPRYRAATALLAALQSCPPPSFLPAYSADILAEEAGRLLLWYVPARTGQPASADFTAAYQAELAQVLAPFADDAPCTILRDYHGQNLHWLAQRQGIARIGLLDFQDALLGHPAYDLASLLGDVRAAMPAALNENLLKHYLAITGRNRAEFTAALAAFGAQRALKILGLFVRLAKQDAKPAYLRLLPRCWQVLEDALVHPHLSSLAAFIHRHIPPPDESGLR